MAWATIREATTDEYTLLEKRAKAFALRHRKLLGNKGHCPGLAWVGFIEDGISYERRFGDLQEAQYVDRLWKRVVQRVLGQGAEGIAYGHVGYDSP